jgi:hypothetical protein
MEVSGQLHASAVSPPGKEPLVPIGYEAGRSGRGGEEKNSQLLLKIEPPINQPVAQPTELPRLIHRRIRLY